MMDNKIASVLLASMLERITRDRALGSVSSFEQRAIRLAIQALGHDIVPATPTIPVPSIVEAPAVQSPDAIPEDMPVIPEQVPVEAPPPFPSVQLVLDALEREAPCDEDVLMCLDFGTAMSKAFASVFPDGALDLELGTVAGQQGYLLPSSAFIDDDGMVYFGQEAIDRSYELVKSGRERLDSIKGWFSLRREGNLDGAECVLQASLNPTEDELTEGDLIRIYLAYLTDMAEIALSRYASQHGEPIGRYVKRRFARPCWPNAAQAEWAGRWMRTMLADAQILADTFHNSWAGGIPVWELKEALDQLRRLGKRPDYLIGEDIPEPVAVAASAIANTHHLRDAFMVIDVGAGTTDFGLFVSVKRDENDEQPRVFQIPASIHGLMQAGNRIDGLLSGFIAHKESINPNDAEGRLIMADLTRRIRSLKEMLFKTGNVEYALADSTIGKVHIEEFLRDRAVHRFAKAIDEGLRKSLQAVDESWLRWLAIDGMRLHVVLTGGSATLPMMQALAQGPIEIKGHRIVRVPVDPKPTWIEDAPDVLLASYSQLAVAIGGAAELLPETLMGPERFGGGGDTVPRVLERQQSSGM